MTAKKKSFTIAEAGAMRHEAKGDRERLRAFVREMDGDARGGIRKLAESAVKEISAIDAERSRIQAMLSYERECRSEGYHLICGIDEAGRGPLAGPVVAGAVILPKDCEILYLNDSKQLTPQRREQLYDEICDKALAVGVGIVGNERIDEINILQADYEAMCEAIGKLSVMPDILLNDAVTIPQVKLPQKAIIKGDAKSLSIAAASVIAKVTRDRLMEELDAAWPEYKFAENKGYGTAAHIAALKKYGPCPIHRRTFIGHFVGI